MLCAELVHRARPGQPGMQAAEPVCRPRLPAGFGVCTGHETGLWSLFAFTFPSPVGRGRMACSQKDRGHLTRLEPEWCGCRYTLFMWPLTTGVSKWEQDIKNIKDVFAILVPGQLDTFNWSRLRLACIGYYNSLCLRSCIIWAWFRRAGVCHPVCSRLED
jgi:hypothetical protein